MKGQRFMAQQSISEEQIRRYLLGRLSEFEMARIERRLMTEYDFFELMLVAEDELIDDYVLERLSGQDRASFENFFLCSPERREKLTFARSLNAYLANAVPKPLSIQEPARQQRTLSSLRPGLSPHWQTAVAALLLVFVLGAVWLKTGARQPASTSSGGAAPFTLSVASLQVFRDVGSAGHNIFTVPSDADQLRLEFSLEQLEVSYPHWQVSILTDEGREICLLSNLRAEQTAVGRILALPLTASILSAGDYRVIISGIAEAGRVKEAGSLYFSILP
jgi:hypothetical protein